MTTDPLEFLSRTGYRRVKAASSTNLSPGRLINGVLFNGTIDITVPADAGTLTGTTLASGVTASSLTSFGAGMVLGTPASGVMTNVTGTASGLTAGNANNVPNAVVIGKVLTGYVSGAGVVAATDTILQAIQKLNGNIAAITGITATITTAQLTTLGAQGSMTFTNGLLTGQTPAT